MNQPNDLSTIIGSRKKFKMKRALSTLLGLLALNLGAQTALDNYLQEASKKNPGLQAKYAAFEASLERAAMVSGLAEPSLSFGYFIQPVETRVGPQRARFSLSQMFPWFGTLEAKGDAAAAIAQANYLRFVDSREKLKSSVKTSYYQLWEINELLELERENLRILRSYEELSTTRLGAGSGKLSDVYRVQIQIEESQTRLELLQMNRESLKKVFNRVLNREVHAAINIPDTVIADESGLNPDSASKHPMVAQFLEMGKSAQLQATAARKSALPKLGLGLDYVIVDERAGITSQDNGRDALMPMVSMSLPIWRKQYTAARKEAELLQKQYQLEAAQTVNQLQSLKDLNDYERQSAWAEVNLYLAKIRLANNTLELTLSDYANDRADFEDVLELQQSIIQYRSLRLKAYSKYLQKLADLEYLLFNGTM